MCVRFRNGRLHASTIARSPRWRSDQIQVCSGSGRRIGMAAVPSSRIRAYSRGSLAGAVGAGQGWRGQLCDPVVAHLLGVHTCVTPPLL